MISLREGILMSNGEIVPVVIETAFGSIEVAINAGAAPITAGNFLAHVDAGLYDGGIFHRTVTLENNAALKAETLNPDIVIEVIQGGADPAKLPDNLHPIPLERTKDTGLLHLDGAISMARGGADTAVEGFFICINAQPNLDFGGKRNPDGQGFAAFGYVTSGMDVVRTIQGQPADGQKLTPAITIKKISRK
ncbi:MAG: peptidylprolyl isomerase [Thermomicrobiales bacterium]|nr:peptidylprolyl isomerase [Thermomicrobiales bacterium]